MKILSHRGYWKESSEKNTDIAFRRSFSLGFGTETDVRDLQGALVISHDMPCGDEHSLSDCLGYLGDRDLPLALNIKADGLADVLAATMRRHEIKDWFVFDMSIPDTRAYLEIGAPVFVRLSEVEQVPVWLDRASGIWLDAFEGEWYDATLIENLIAQGKRVCVVSPELHRRPHLHCWSLLSPLRHHEGLMLCTDFPELARAYFEARS